MSEGEPAMRIRCVVPATDDPPTLKACVAAIRRSSSPPENLVCVTDPALRGPAAARNEGAEDAEEEVLVFVDADVIVHPDAFTLIRAALRDDPELAGVFGAYDDAPEAPGAVSGFRNLLHHSVHAEGAGPAQTFWAGLGSVRRDAFRSVGGFDVDRFPRPAMEDVDLGLRLTAAGHRIELDPAIRGTHLKRWTLPEMVRTDFARRGLPWTELLLEHGRGGAELNLSTRHRLSAAASLTATLALALRRPRVALAALLGMVALNGRLYLLIWRRRGASQAAAALPLHMLHHLTAIAAAACGLILHLARAPRRQG